MQLNQSCNNDNILRNKKKTESIEVLSDYAEASYIAAVMNCVRILGWIILH